MKNDEELKNLNTYKKHLSSARTFITKDKKIDSNIYKNDLLTLKELIEKKLKNL